jgi:uncharacterized membrane protein YtjA (UPF0391 family)
LRWSGSVGANTLNHTPGDDHARDHNVAARSTADRDHSALSDLLITSALPGTYDPGAAFFWRRLSLHNHGAAMATRPAGRGVIMGNLLHYAIVFLVVALVAAAIGFGGVAGVAMEGARLLFWVFIILFLVSLVAGVVRRG